MTSFNVLGKFRIIIAVILALIIARLGISYLIILLAIGIILSILNSKMEAVITGVLYAIVSYILSYPAGLFLADYMPTTNVTIETSATTVGINLMMGAIIPTIIAIILCGIGALIGSTLVDLIHKNNNSENKQKSIKEEHHYEVIEGFKRSREENKRNKKQKREIIYQTPIQKSKIRQQKQNNEKGD
ncbi:hypothetical protein [Methanosphaera sp. WGK6]|uniref:hypothetical protein n=1 Tax=Methanosphaera sp. WGK6 TaxID=1561964 RepID=UPI00084CB2A3|nr:hypothetical protein [Methanosphaera sp. WGK6]OED29571.1 hypothetical protein NL43_07470 [Methanosphaera sp. WGK6]